MLLHVCYTEVSEYQARHSSHTLYPHFTCYQQFLLKNFIRVVSLDVMQLNVLYCTVTLLYARRPVLVYGVFHITALKIPE